ncbi:MAG: ATP-binding protein [Candidatus Tectomicrobia bacterium]|uniref:ATP-binding protein n=1 Tax=Tectimicrobiota bacterium TaxID=2528274 RepID=A0A932CL66_UNCTE|nr:ATP-binding protein [Candidatus Tectomicrobia bacterium]
MRFFNTAGPVDCQRHYCLPPLSRFDLEEVLSLIAQEKYFVLHAPRQVGKTSCLLALMDYLNREGHYRCLYANVEMAQTAREDVKRGMQAILNEISSMALSVLGDSFLEEHWPQVLERVGGDGALNKVLTLWAEQNPQPLVLLLDEIDALVGDTLISALRQLRAGYPKRPRSFPQTDILCGVRDVRDYRIHSDREKAIIMGGSAFNVKAKSLRLGDFSRDEMAILYQQHTEETGQAFDAATLDLAWELTRGQPWLVNALGYEVCFEMEQGRDRSRPITAGMLVEAKERLILRRETHLDQLMDKLQEARVRRVISPMLQGMELERQVSQDDIQYVIDLGLVHRGSAGLEVANGIYREVIPRELTFIAQLNFESTVQPAWYIGADGQLDMARLLEAFQAFFREHSESWVERFDYKEAGPQLLLQAFLQRILNSGGRVEREYGLGRRRTDLMVIWPYPGGVQRVVIELKIVHSSLERTLAEGLVQTRAYMDRCGTDEGHLVIFDREPGKPWEEKIFRQAEVYQGKRITVWGM